MDVCIAIGGSIGSSLNQQEVNLLVDSIGFSGNQHIDSDLMKLGSKLSLVIGCNVTRPSAGKNVFICEHGVPFQMFRLRGSDDWGWAKEEHNALARAKNKEIL